jgi:hypothetical protein
VRWPNTTHDWTRSVDAEHLATIRRQPRQMAPTGALHLTLEVLAYAGRGGRRTRVSPAMIMGPF